MTTPSCYFPARHRQIKVANTPVCANTAAQDIQKIGEQGWAAQSKPYRGPMDREECSNYPSGILKDMISVMNTSFFQLPSAMAAP